MERINVLDHGYLEHIESWGTGKDGKIAQDFEVGIIEAARQSTQGSFRSWKQWICNKCGGCTATKITGTHLNGQLKECDGRLSNDEALLNFMYSHNHSTPFEFAGMTIEVEAPLMVFREWHRHRTQSYNEMSARYAPLPDKNYIPTKERLFQTQKNNTQAKAIDGSQLDDPHAEAWLHELDAFYEQAESLYQAGLKWGIPKELARLCIPVGRYSRMRASGNLRNWLAFLTLRNHPNAQWEIQEFARAVSRIIENQFPHTFQIFNEGK